MNRKLASILQYVFFLGLGIFLVWWSVGQVSAEQWAEIRLSIKGARFVLLVPVVIALLIAHWSRAIRWKILMEPMGYRPGNMNTYCAVLVGYLANLAVPRLGEVLKCTLLARYEKIPADKLIGTIVAERAFDLICLVLVSFITVFSQIDVIGQFVMEKFRPLVTGGSHEADPLRLLFLLLLVVVLLALAYYFFRRFSHTVFMQKLRKVLFGIWEGLTSIRLVQQKGWFFFHTILIWFLYLASIRLGLLALQETSHLGWLPSFSILTMGSLGMIVTPGGIGAYPALVQETMVLYGTGEAIGIAFGWLLWLAQFFLVLAVGFLALLLLPALNRQTAKTA